MRQLLQDAIVDGQSGGCQNALMADKSKAYDRWRDDGAWDVEIVDYH